MLCRVALPIDEFTVDSGLLFADFAILPHTGVRAIYGSAHAPDGIQFGSGESGSTGSQGWDAAARYLRASIAW